MFDIAWGELVLIGVVALIVIGPKELPGVLRAIGQWTTKIRRMAAEFQSQFQEAMREAEMADLKKQVDDIATDIKQYDPLKDVRADLEAAGKGIQTSLEQPPLMTSGDTAAAETSAPELPAPANLATVTDPVAPQASESATEPITTRQAG